MLVFVILYHGRKFVSAYTKPVQVIFFELAGCCMQYDIIFPRLAPYAMHDISALDLVPVKAFIAQSKIVTA